MRFERMRPAELRAAAAAGLPVVLPVGVMEYHGEHLPAGMDLLAVTAALDRLEAEAPGQLVILPPFAYGAASHAVAGPEGTGTLHVEATALVPVFEGLFGALLAGGFRNVHALIHHQTENFAQGMPTDLALRLAARQAIFRHLEATRGPGWWGAAGMADYYGRQAAGESPFDWVRVHPLMDAALIERYPFDHAGPGETGLMCALAPETVDLSALGPDAPWYVRGAETATAERGEAGVALILARLRRLLLPGGGQAARAPT